MSVSTTSTTATGQQLVALGNTRVGDPYIFGALAPKNDPLFHGPWDCAEFVSWLIFQTTGKLYGCENNAQNPATANAFTGFFERDAHSLGNIVSVEEAASAPGALLLRTAVPALGGHIVVCDGMGGTVEAHSHNDGVIKGKIANRRWDIGIRVPGVSYEALPVVPVEPPHTTIFCVSTPIMTSLKVGEIQRALLNAGFDPHGIDSKYGNETAKAVIAFQKQKGLLVDGEVGAQTAAALGVVL
ncbi:MAG: peptidoglycan-binding domain-containing protein [Bacteroidota bacterium]|nr:peptidoglycan-binding domain-containing protein [Bacteroidota bacterium]